MNNQLHRVAIVLAWLALPLTWFQYHAVWDRLPARMATHFNAAGEANGWMTRESAVIFPLVLAGLFLVVFTAILARVRMREREFWALFGSLYLLLGVLAYVNSSIIEYNLTGHPIQAGPVLIAVFVGALVFVPLFLSARRGQNLPARAVIAKEVHAGRSWAVIFLVPLVVEIAVLVSVPAPAVRSAMVLAIAIFAVIAVACWEGFDYIFTTAGVDVRVLGFRLCSIPAAQIKSYAAQRWNPLGGYGIRGVGGRRAYIWGNNGVSIKTTDGEVFLGHEDPERIIRDLDLVTQSYQGREAIPMR